ncbi:conserved hypothetical protein [Methylocella tundrae]|jgi:hypothetical protein|uniref:DUF1214 domain-containing protein n=1 Tax=Methylocella tundrae TaxID=227605 RepID=A0A8B6M5Z0_METTU|nr:DUF1214 domain-containing protein [Methylocella tundrae]VTZ50248.1 conserved hypothetical protein [Methylocella tundrae]
MLYRDPSRHRLRDRAALLGKFLLVGVAGGVIGLCVTFAALRNGFGFGAVEAGPWTAWPRNGAGNIDPYSRATLALSGEIPLGASEGISFVALDDSAGNRFDASCDYTVSGQTPQARYWTLTVMTPKGRLIANPAERNGFTSSEILRSADGGFAITLSHNARPGNWLALGSDRSFILVLRLYETEFSAATLAFDASSLPTIVRGACR